MAKTREQGTTGLVEFSGIIADDFLRELRGKEGYKRFREMHLNSPIVGGMLFYIEQAIRKVSWNFGIKGQGREDKTVDPRVDFLNYARDAMSQSWNDFIIEALSMLPYGYSIFWTNIRRDEHNNLIWDNFSPRGQDTVYQWIFNHEGSQHYDATKRRGEILGFTQMAPPTYKTETLWMKDLLHFRTRVERNNPEGRSMLRNSWIPYYYVKHLQQIEAIGVERDLAGLPVITLPQGADTAETENSDLGKAQQVVRNVRNDEQAGLTLPFGWTFELASTGGSRAFDTDAIIKRYESRIFMTLLMQFIMLSQDGIGSAALSKDSTSVAEMVVNSIADIIAETFTNQAIPRLLKLNGYDPEGVVLEHTPAGDTDVVQLADMLTKVGTYITWDGEDELWLRQVVGLPERSVEELTAAREVKDAAKAEAARAFAQRINQGEKEEPDKDKPEDAKKDENTISVYAADPPDQKKRQRFEREWDKAMQAFFEAQRKRVMREARKMKGG